MRCWRHTPDSSLSDRRPHAFLRSERQSGAVFNSLLAFLTEDHRRENLAIKVYRTFVQLVKSHPYIYIYVRNETQKEEARSNCSATCDYHSARGLGGTSLAPIRFM